MTVGVISRIKRRCGLEILIREMRLSTVELEILLTLLGVLDLSLLEVSRGSYSYHIFEDSGVKILSKFLFVFYIPDALSDVQRRLTRLFQLTRSLFIDRRVAVMCKCNL